MEFADRVSAVVAIPDQALRQMVEAECGSDLENFVYRFEQRALSPVE